MSDGVFITSLGLGDHVSHGYPILCRLRERHERVFLVGTHNFKPLAECLGGYDGARFLDVGQFSDSATVGRAVGELVESPESAVFYNINLNNGVCSYLGRMAGRGAEVRGFYKDAGGLRSSSDAGRRELGHWLGGRIASVEEHLGCNRRDRNLNVLGLPGYGDEFVPFGPFTGRRASEPDSRLVIFEHKAGSPSKSYTKGAAELKALLEGEGWEVLTPSEAMLPIPELLSRISGAAGVISVDSFVANVGWWGGVPTLAVCGPTCPDDLSFGDYIVNRLACGPCYSHECDVLLGDGSCLDNISPGRVLYAFNKLLEARGRERVRINVSRQPRASFAGRRVSIFCVDDWRSALRYSLRLSHAFASAGAETRLFVGGAFDFLAGGVPWLAGVSAASPGANGLAESALDCDYGVFLGRGSFQDELARGFAERGIPKWHCGSVFNSASRGSLAGCSSAWERQEERGRSAGLLCEMNGVPWDAEAFGRDWGAACDNIFGPLAEGREGRICLDCASAGVPGLVYPWGSELARLLGADYSIFDIGASLSEGLGSIAWAVRNCRGVLTVNSVALDIGVLMGAPTLLMQGPLRESPSNAPHVIRSTCPDDAELGRLSLDRPYFDGRHGPESMAAEFREFLESSSKGRWANVASA